MKSRLRLSSLLAIAVLGVFALAQTQKPQSPNSEVPKFDPDHEVTIHGTVQQVEDYQCPISKTIGTHVTLKTSSGPIEAHVAGAKFLQQYGIKFNVGDSVEMTGTKGTYMDKPAFLPRMIVVGQDRYYLRDAKGNPLW